MFDSVRKHQRLLLLVVVVLIFPAFAFFGIQGYDRFFSDGDNVAKVSGEAITRNEFEQAQREQLERLRQMLGGAVDPQMLDTPAARREVLEGLIVQRVMSAHARSSLISVSDERLRETIRGIPGLTTPDGTFDLERYRALVASRARSESMFEAELRRDIAMQALPDALAQSAILPQTVLRQMVRIISESREVAELRIKPADFSARLAPDEAQVRRHYDDNPTTYQLPESATVQYVVLDVDAVGKKMAVPATDVAAFYEQNRKRFGVPEERKVSHILVKVDAGASAADKQAARDKAQSLLKQLRAGANFEALARKESQDPGSAREGGDLGFFGREMMVKPFADAAFDARQGDVAGPVETEFGYHLLRVTGIRPAKEKALEEVRAEIESELRRGQANRRFAEDAEVFGNLVYEQSDSLQPVVERFGLTVQDAPQVSRSGVRDLPREHPLNHPKLLNALFASDAVTGKRNTEAVDVGGGRVVSARIVEHRPSRLKPFDEVKAEAREAWIRDEARKLAVAAGQERLKALQGGAKPEGFTVARELSRSGQSPLPGPAMEAVFRASIQKLPAFVGADLGGEGYAIYEIRKVSVPDDKTLDAKLPELRTQLDQMLSQQDMLDYVESLKGRTDVSRSLSRLGSVKAE